ncbi:hypothetical protein [Streptomyces mirabilis]|uniref:hypothetical protein n=1 Tax=Streptomyces mirabilis TaxID=68239 RepID=UPI0036B2CF16
MSHVIEYSRAATSTDARTPTPAATVGRARRNDPQERRRRHTLELLAVSALGLAPWTVRLGLTLPSDYRVHAWRTTWVGFDILLLTALGMTTVLAKRRHRAAMIPAVATAVLLVCDAWFDVSLDLGTSAVWASAALAVFVELPMAAFLFYRVHTLLRSPCDPQQATDTA